MSLLEYRLASFVLRLIVLVQPPRARAPAARRAGHRPRSRLLEGNLLHLHDAIRRASARTSRSRSCSSRTRYDLVGKVRYLARMVRGTWLVHTSGLVVVDNAYLPVHVAPHRPETTVVQVWHAPGALKRFGADTAGGARRARATFLHRYYDYVVAPGEGAREAWSRALRTPVERVLPLGTPRTDRLYDTAALDASRAWLLARVHPGARAASGSSSTRRRSAAGAGQARHDGAGRRAPPRAACPTTTRWCSSRIPTSTRRPGRARGSTWSRTRRAT